MLGVPDLTDEIWVYGPAPSAIRAQIWHGANGRGPPRQARTPGQLGPVARTSNAAVTSIQFPSLAR